MDVLVKTTFIGTTNMKDYNTKRCTNYLLLRNLLVPDLLKEKREAVFNHKQSMMGDINGFDNGSAQYFLHSLCKLVSNVMNAANSKESNLSVHSK